MNRFARKPSAEPPENSDEQTILLPVEQEIFEDKDKTTSSEETTENITVEIEIPPDNGDGEEIFTDENGNKNVSKNDADGIDVPIKLETPDFIPNVKINKEDVQSVIKIPQSDIKKLFITKNMLPVPVHGVLISVNLEEFEKLSDANPHALSTVNALSAALEESISLEEAVKIRDRQVFSFKTGSSIMEDITVSTDTSSLEVIIPNFARNLVIEDVSGEGFNFENDDTATLINVKPEFRDKTGGLEHILKKTTVVTVLNMLQQEGKEKEFMFYANLLNKMQDSHTFKLILPVMRSMMQYALNCDTFLLQSVMTDLILNQGDNNDGEQ